MNNGKVRRALITGASSGMGAEFARQLAAEGTNLILVARRKEKLDLLAGNLRRDHRVEVEVIPSDLMKTEDIEGLERRITETSDLDLLVNNAGFGGGGKFSASAVGSSLDMIRVQVVAPVRLTRAAIEGMMARKRGHIINVASLAAFSPLSGTTYASTKGYLVRFSQGLQIELHGSGVRIQALCPGFTHTEFHANMGDFKAGIPRFMWMAVDKVVRTSLNAIRGRKVVCVPGGINRLLFALMRCPPTAALMTAAGRLPIIRKRSE